MAVCCMRPPARHLTLYRPAQRHQIPQTRQPGHRHRKTVTGVQAVGSWSASPFVQLRRTFAWRSVFSGIHLHLRFGVCMSRSDSHEQCQHHACVSLHAACNKHATYGVIIYEMKIVL